MKFSQMFSLWLLLSVALLGLHLIRHEDVHVQQCKYFGGNATTEYGLTGGVTYCDLKGTQRTIYNQTSVMVEAVSYQIEWLLIAFLACTGFIMFLHYVRADVK